MWFLAFLSALQAVRQPRLHPLSQLELWDICIISHLKSKVNIDWGFLIHLLPRYAYGITSSQIESSPPRYSSLPRFAEGRDFRDGVKLSQVSVL